LLGSVDVVLSNRQDGPKTYDVVIGEDAGGLPGSSLEVAAIAVADIRALLTATFSGTSVLRANQQYWLWVKPRGVDEGTWHFNPINDMKAMVISNNDGATWTPVDPFPRPVFRVSGTPLPEPTAFVLGITALGILLPCRLRPTCHNRV
jgi:hypothetical protein